VLVAVAAVAVVVAVEVVLVVSSESVLRSKVRQTSGARIQAMNTTKRISVAMLAALMFTAGCTEAQRTAMRNRRNAKNWMNPSTPDPGEVQIAEHPKILPETFFAAARLFESQGQYDKAITQYRKAISVNHEYAEAYNRLGILLGIMGQNGDAEQALVTAVRLKPQSAVYRNNLGFQYALAGRWSDAQAELSNAIRLKPDFNRAYVNLGIALAKQQQFEKAFDAFSAALPEADAYYNLGLMFRADNRYRDAADSFNQVLAINRNFQAAQKQLEEIQPKLALQNQHEPITRTAPQSVAVNQPAAAPTPAYSTAPITAAPQAPAPQTIASTKSQGDISLVEVQTIADEHDAITTGSDASLIHAEIDAEGDTPAIEIADAEIITEETAAPISTPPSIAAAKKPIDSSTADVTAPTHGDVAIIEATPIAAPPIAIDRRAPANTATTTIETSPTALQATPTAAAPVKDHCFESHEIHEYDSYDFSCDDPDGFVASPIRAAVQSIARSSQHQARPVAARKTAKSEIITASDESVLVIEAQTYVAPEAGEQSQ
jgi:tetratricopeptide (TPR) repeat protein